MGNVICNFIPTDKDINVYSVSREKDIDNTCDSNVYVYIAKIKDIQLYFKNSDLNIGGLTCKNNSIQSSSAYALLKYAVKDRWGIDEDFSTLGITENGKPYIEGYKFSISHSEALVCVAISKNDVGVDLECATKRRNWLGLRRRVLTQKENEELATDNETMTSNWTQKEAVFKLMGGRVFSPNAIALEGYYIDTITDISLDEDNYILSVATKEKSESYLFVKKVVVYKDALRFC